MTSQEIYAEVQKGKLVLLRVGDDYVSCAAANESEARFENSTISSDAVAADGEKYNVQLFKLYRVVGNKYSSSNFRIPVQAYIDAQVAYQKPYELIQSFTITEDGTKKVSLDGFELDKFALYLFAPTGDVEGGFNFYVYKGEETVFYRWVNNVFSKTLENNVSGFYGKNENGIAFIEYAAGSSVYKPIYTVPGYIEGITPFTKLSFALSGSSTVSFPTGTKIDLWGVRANG